jgi:Ca-activated chloride channel family protein
VSFSTEAQVTLRPDADREQVMDALETIPKPGGATAIGDAMALGGQILPPSGRRAIVLITDGVNNRGADPLEVAQDLANHHIPVYTIGIGTNTTQKIIGTDEEASVDPDALKQISDLTGATSTIEGDANAISTAFSTLARSTIWEVQKIDGSTVIAFLGSACVLGGFFLGFGLGKF